jgi:AcrR family transcriptional regulator
MDASRQLFGSKGFHSTPMAELAIEARVSVGQI